MEQLENRLPIHGDNLIIIFHIKITRTKTPIVTQ